MIKKRITELDSLRGIAALSVVLFHFTMKREQAQLGFNIGCMGVDMFFIISGFVIFMSIQNISHWKDFVWSRFSRLYPAYWACVTLTTGLTILLQKVYFKQDLIEVAQNISLKYLANMTMFQYYFNIENIDGPYWTLIIELVFYIFILILLLTKMIRHIETLGFLLLFVSLSYSFDAVASNVYFQKFQFIFPLINYFPLFYSGIIIYKMKFEKITAMRFFSLALSLIFQCLMFENCYHTANYLSISQYVPVLIGIYGVFILFLFDKLTFITNPVTIWLGKISYSLYLFHQYVGRALIPGIMKYLHLDFWTSAIITLTIILITATMINKFIEKPGMKYLRNKLKDRHDLSKSSNKAVLAN